MTKGEYTKAYQSLAHQYSSGQISFEQMKERIRQLEDHAHEFQKDVTGEAACWCGAIK